MRVADYIMSFIADQGVGHVFVLPGGGCMHLADALGEESRLQYVACLHEQAAAVAADGYAQYTRNLGVALVTTGPGSTNAVTGVAGSWVESVPVLILSGQVKTADIKPSPEMRMLGFQEVDIVSIVEPITKYAATVTEASSIRYHLEKAVYLAQHGRPGPVWINVPLDIQAQVINPEQLQAFSQSETGPMVESEDTKAAVSRMLGLLEQSSRPVIIAGCGIKLAHSESLFVQTAERLGVPVLTTWKACDLLSDDHPSFCGRPGVLAHRGANFIQQNSDFLLAIGARLDFGQIGYASDTFARAAKKVIVDVDPWELRKFRFTVDVPLVASADTFLTELARQLENWRRPDWSAWWQRCRGWRKTYPVVTREHREQRDWVNTYVLVEALAQQMTAEDLLVPGSSGACSDICLQAFQVKAGQRVLNSPGIGSMGFGLPHTLGVCLASGKRRTICVNGDGGFQLNIQELETVRRLGLPIKYFVLNNSGYGSIRVTQRNYFQGRLVASDPHSGLTLPDIRRIADAYGIPNNRVANHRNLEACLAEALASHGPFICDVMVDPDEQTGPKVKSAVGSHGQMISKPLEDLAPFLDRAEFAANMMIPPLP